MKISIETPLALNAIGKRDNNEDSIFPALGTAQAQDVLFMVCDGVGGQTKGEVASAMVCEHFAQYFSQNRLKISQEQDILAAFEYVQNKFDEYIAQNPEVEGMASTLSLLHLHEAGATVAHCGDSRVYQFRQGKIIFKTLDHNIVNEMLKQGIISEKEAQQSQKSNRISRAIQGNKVSKTKPDISQIRDLQAGDYFLLCSDGVSDSLSDAELSELLQNTESLEEIIASMEVLCEANAKDNYSAYLICLKEVKNGEEDTLIDEASLQKGKLKETPQIVEVVEEEKTEPAASQKKKTRLWQKLFKF